MTLSNLRNTIKIGVSKYDKMISCGLVHIDAINLQTYQHS